MEAGSSEATPRSTASGARSPGRAEAAGPGEAQTEDTGKALTEGAEWQPLRQLLHEEGGARASEVAPEGRCEAGEGLGEDEPVEQADEAEAPPEPAAAADEAGTLRELAEAVPSAADEPTLRQRRLLRRLAEERVRVSDAVALQVLQQQLHEGSEGGAVWRGAVPIGKTIELAVQRLRQQCAPLEGDEPRAVRDESRERPRTHTAASHIQGQLCTQHGTVQP